MKNKLKYLYNNNDSTLITLILMSIIVAFAGELKMYPFNDNFRISFGMPAFFFLLLLSRNSKAILSGFVIGIAVVIFRTIVDLPTSDLIDAFVRHYPTLFYYITFGFLFTIAKMKNIKHMPILVGLIGIGLDVLSSFVELTVQYIAFSSISQFEDFHKIFIISIFRSFFVVGLYNFIILHNTQVKKEHIEIENKKLTLLISELYQETINLNKTLINSENVTEKSYNLYRKLKNIDNLSFDFKQNNLAKLALEITGESHEIKKDNQRILSGLSRLISEKNLSEYMYLNDIVNIAINSNKNYVKTLDKEINFTQTIRENDLKYHVYNTLSLINNLITNAAEAINNSGIINLDVDFSRDNIVFQVSDDGPGIKNDNLEVIFKPGFTTKYDSDGSASSGIGLSYVTSLTEQLNGTITVQNNAHSTGASFTMTLPINSLTKQEDF